MSYKFSKGSQVIGDLKAADDTQRDTLIDFGEDYIGLQTSGSLRMVISGSDGKVGIGTATPDYTLDVAGDIGVDKHIYHNGDGDTFIAFGDTENAVQLSAGGSHLNFTPAGLGIGITAVSSNKNFRSSRSFSSTSYCSSS